MLIVAPLNLVSESLILGVERLILVIEPLILVIESLILVVESLSLVVESLILTVEPLILVVESLILTVEPLNLVSELLSFVVESLNLAPVVGWTCCVQNSMLQEVSAQSVLFLHSHSLKPLHPSSPKDLPLATLVLLQGKWRMAWGG
jgi:hypothetical protein